MTAARPFYIEALEELASALDFRDDPRGVPDPIRGYGNTAPGRCAFCKKESWEAIRWPRHPQALEPADITACIECVRALAPGLCMVHNCGEELPERLKWKLICARHYARYTAYAGRVSTFNRSERSLIAELYMLDGEPLHVSRANDHGGFFRAAAGLNMRFTLPGVQPVLMTPGGFARLNLRWLREAVLDIPRLCSSPVSYTVLNDLRPVASSRTGVYMPPGSSADLFAEWLAANLTESERLFLALMRQLGIASEFQPQVRIGGYVVDFLHCGLLTNGSVCSPFIVEIDGSSHHGKAARARDAARTQALKLLGYKVIRFSNDAVKYQPASVAKAILSMRSRVDSR